MQTPSPFRGLPAGLTARTQPTPRRSSPALFIVLALIVLALALILVFGLHLAPYPGPPVLFEDGSFVIGPVTGCLPWGICN